MPTFTETSTLQSLEIFPALNVINVKKVNTTFKDGVKFAEQVDAKSYSTSQFSDFAIEVAPTGGTLAEIVAGFSQAALDAASALPATLAAKATAEAALSAANAAHTAALAAKDAEMEALEAQVAALTPVPPTDPREIAKAARAVAVAAIKVTTQAGNTFDGDEDSQGRMARAIIALSTGLAPSVNWVLADNSVIQATAAELTEALVLSGMAQAALWVLE